MPVPLTKWLVLLASCGALACGDDGGGGRSDGGPLAGQFAGLVNFRTEADCGCVTDYTLHAEVGCTFTLVADAVDGVGAPFTEPLELLVDASGWDGSASEMLVLSAGEFRWTHTVIGDGEPLFWLSIEATGSGHQQLLTGHPVRPSPDGPYALCAYWTDTAGQVIPQEGTSVGLGFCGGELAVDTEVGLHVELRGLVDGDTVQALIREDDGGGVFDRIDTLELSVAGTSATGRWTTAFPALRDGPGEAEVYFLAEVLRGGVNNAVQEVESARICVE